MTPKAPEIYTLEQHQHRVLNDPDAYRPAYCPHCGKAGLHHHGDYRAIHSKERGLLFYSGCCRFSVSFVQDAAVLIHACQAACLPDVTIGGKVSRKYWSC